MRGGRCTPFLVGFPTTVCHCWFLSVCVCLTAIEMKKLEIHIFLFQLVLKSDKDFLVFLNKVFYDETPTQFVMKTNIEHTCPVLSSAVPSLVSWATLVSGAS